VNEKEKILRGVADRKAKSNWWFETHFIVKRVHPDLIYTNLASSG